MAMKNFYFTFVSNGNPDIRCVKVTAPDQLIAKQAVVEAYGTNELFVYTEEQFEHIKTHFELVEELIIQA